MIDDKNIVVFTESHSGWTYRQTMTGEYEIIDQSGWALATIHYDYRFTCNATNRYRAELLASAPETRSALAAARLAGRVEQATEDAEMIEANTVCYGSEGQLLRPRKDSGDTMGLAYAVAIRARIAEIEKEPRDD
jgi:hypothetical protein